MRYADALTRLIAPGPLLCDGEPEKPCGCGPDETCAQRNGRRLGRLEALADMGVDMARGAHRAHLALPPEDSEAGATPEAAQVRAVLNLAFSRAARAAERAIQLEARLHATGGTLNVHWRAPEQPRSRADFIRTRKTVVAFPIEAAIETEAYEDEVDDWLADLEDRIEAAPDDDAFVELPQEVMVARVCHDLRLPRDWAIWDTDCCPQETARLDRAKAKPPP